MRTIKITVVFFLAVSVLAASAPAQAQDAGALAQRLERLERDIQTLSKMVVRGPSAISAADAPAAMATVAPVQDLPQNAVARIGVRLDTLENELRQVTGRIEELTYNLEQLTQRVDRLVADMDFRLSGLEQQGRPPGAQPRGPAAQGLKPGEAAQGDTAGAARLPQSVQVIGQGPQSLGTIEANRVKPVAPSPVPGAGHAGAPPPPPGQLGQAAQIRPALPTAQQGATQPQPQQPLAEQASLPEGTPDEQYKYAFGLLRKHQFDQAEGAFRQFLQKNGDGPLAGNARYWLGETHYARAEYVKAAEVFLQGFEKDPKGAKAPDSLLKLAMSLGQLGQTKEACGAIVKLFADYPYASSSLKRTATRQQRQMKCK
ncbi:MAG: tol-pal system protein YbgF [Rhodospirillaceae bacterium]